MFPEDFVTSTGCSVILNDGQRYLNRCWLDIETRLPMLIDLLIFNGDVNEGQNVAEECRGLVEQDPLFQARASVHRFRNIASRAKRIVCTKGSTYHSGRGASNEEFFAQLIGAEQPLPNQFTYSWFKDTLDDVYLDVSHRQSFTLRYREMPLEREVGFYLERIARSRNVRPNKVLIVRSHTHVGYRLYEERGIMAVSTPSMKLQDDFAKTSRSPNRLFPDCLGVVGFETTDDPDTAVIVHKYLYDHPE